MNSNQARRSGRTLAKRLPILVGAVVLSGGVFLTAQGLTDDGPLPAKHAPLTVDPAAQHARSSPSTNSNVPASCRDDDGSFDDNGNDACKRLITVMPTPNVLAGDDDRGRHGHGDDDAPGTEDHHGGRAGGDDDAPGTEDRHGGRGSDDSQAGDDHGGHGGDDRGRDDHGGEDHGGDDHGGHGGSGRH